MSGKRFMSRTINHLSQNIIRTQVNDNMEELFNMEHDPVPMVDNQILQKTEKKKGRGGARPNSGRKVGSTVKLSATDILAEIAKRDVPFAEGLAEDYARARQSGDLMLVQRYQQMFLNKVVADKQEVDMTSNGQTMNVGFTFPSIELSEWKNESN
jgi:hypothetical protein